MTKVDSSKMNTGKIYKGEYEVFIYNKQKLSKLRRLETENEQLRKKLKECKPYIALYTENNKHIGFTPETANLLQQIKKALGEDK